MKELQSKTIYLYNRDTGEYEPVTALRGESAYVAAKRLGLTTLTEEEWLQEYVTKRNAAIADIDNAAEEAIETIDNKSASAVIEIENKTEEITQTAADEITRIENKGTEVLNSIPSDYTALTELISSYGFSVVDGCLCVTYSEEETTDE